MLLSSKGYDVKVFEKQSYIGGRNAEIRLGEYKFDMGPTFLSMLHIAEELFIAIRRNIHDYLQLVELDPMYELIFDHKKLLMTRNKEKMKSEIELQYSGKRHRDGSNGFSLGGQNKQITYRIAHLFANCERCFLRIRI